MKSIKTHFGVIFSLIALLFSIQFGVFVNSLIKNYELSMKNEYSIVLVSKKELNIADVNQTVSELFELKPISTNEIMQKLKDKISDNNMKLLKESIPKFYNVKLQFFPNSDELRKITVKLEKVDGVSRVEVFLKTHDTIYRVLVLIKSIVYIFTFLIILLGLMLIHKQMRIWIFEHKERIEIMALFGASYIVKSAKLYKMAIVDSIIATMAVVVFYKFLPNWNLFKNTMDTIGTMTNTINLPFDGIVLLIISLLLSIVAVSLVMIQVKSESR